MPTDGKVAVLFVCLGNICRSPLAEGAFRRAAADAGLAERFRVDSAGVSDYNAGEPPDPRAVAAAARRGLDIRGLRARPVRPIDFLEFDWMLAMDRSNLAGLRTLAPDHALARIGLLRDIAEGRPEPIPDPYFGTPDDFERVLDAVETATKALVRKL
jgi:protein-tyrosine phosphatase